MTKVLYDVSVKGELRQWYPIGVASTPAKCKDVYRMYVESGGIPGEVLITPRTEHLYLNVGR